MIRYIKPRAVIGAIQLPTDHTGELEYAKIINRFPRIILRLQKATSDTFVGCDSESYRSLMSGIERAVDSLKPKSRLNAIGLACTSMSYVIGLENIDSVLRNTVDHTVKVTSIGSSLIKAINHLHIKRISLICPYTDDLTKIIIDQLTRRDIEVITHENFGITDDTFIEQIDPEYIKERVVAHSTQNTDCIVVCCSGLRIVDMIDELETLTNRVIITSSQAFIWDLLRSSNIDDRVYDIGKLFSL
jgi:maleate isomerase